MIIHGLSALTRPRFHQQARRCRSIVHRAIGASWWSPGFERLENRCVLSSVTPLTVGIVPLPNDPTVEVSGTIPQPGAQELYQVNLDTQGLLVAVVHAPGNRALLSLQDNQGHTLIQSEAGSQTNPDDRIAQHLPAGTYQLAVSSLAGSGAFSLSTTFTSAAAPSSAISETQGSYAVTTADLNADGKSDLIVPDYYYDQVLINYGLGDGTFQPPVAVPVGTGPTDVLAARLFGDGELDLVVVDQLSNDLTILKGDGQGDFQVAQVLRTGPGPVNVVAGDFSGDGLLDLAVADQGSNGVEIFRNTGNGSFVASSWIGSITSPTALAVANLNGDGRADLVVSSAGPGNLILLDGEGHDQFAALPYQLPVGPGCSDVIAANFSGAGLSDLAAVSSIDGTISIFHNDGFAYRLKGTLQAGSSPKSLVAADFNGDGQLDLAVANSTSNDVSVFLDEGHDTFGTGTTYSTGAGPIGVATADFNGDDRPDLVTADYVGQTVSVLLNNRDATFTSPPPQPPLAAPDDVVVADLTGNGIDDLIVPDIGLNVVEVFLGRGDGTFRDPILIPAGSGPEDLTVGDFTGDGIDDMAIVDDNTNTLLILKGKGDGTFAPIETLATGNGPEFLKTADLDGDGHLDLVVADYLGNDIDLFYGKGDGTFTSAVSVPVGLGPGGIAISDLNGDGRLDIAICDSGSNDLKVFMATGTRSYASPVTYATGAQPWFVTSGDFNNDGHPDLIVSDALSTPSVVSLLLNSGNGTFLPLESFGVGGNPYPLTIGDFNHDGNLDVVVGNDATNDLSLLIGHGNGTFSPEIRLPSGIDPYGLAVGDFNGDGHLDLVAVNYQSSNLTILIGQGNGTFAIPQTVPLISPDLPTITAQLEGNGVDQVLVANPLAGTISVFDSQGDGTLVLITTIDVGGNPSGMVVGDFNGDGRPDLAVTDSSGGEVLILLGLGNGTFQSPTPYDVGKSPRSPVLGDFNHDGVLDIAVADTNSNEISVLDGRGDGTFEPARSFPVGQEPVELVIGGVDARGDYDLGTVNRTSNNLSLLIGQPDGNFATINYNLPGITTSDVVTGDFDGDGSSDVIFLDEATGTAFVERNYAQALASGRGQYPLEVNLGLLPGNYLVSSADLYNNGQSDLILANLDTGVVTVFGAWSKGTFQSRISIQVDAKIAALSVDDLNNDGLPDLLITEAGTGQVETYLSGGTGLFSAAESTVPLPHPSPVIFPQGVAGQSNIVSNNQNGQVLERFGIAGATAQFGPPVNLSNGSGLASRDDAVVRTGGVPDVALLVTNQPIIVIQRTDNVSPSGRSYLSLPALGSYTRLISGDLFETGLDALVVINRTLNEIIIFQQISSGVFQRYGQPIPAGFGPTDVTLAQLTPGALPDLVVADGSSGAVTLIGRDSGGGFVVEAILPAGLATAGTVLLPGGLNRTSPDQPVSVTSGVFSPSGLADVVVVDHGTNRISILQGLAGGELAAPSLALTYSTGLAPIQVVAASLTRSGLLDLVVLNEGSHDISIFLNNGQGGFTTLPRINAGDSPASLAVSDVTGDGVPDLIVSNSSGDILILAGNGDGSFQPYERADGTVNLAVGDLTGNGQNDFVLTNTSQDLLSVQIPSSSVGFLQGRGNGLLAPGPVAIADMNGDGIADLIVTNTGGNDVLVYLGLGGGRFAAPQEFFTGTAPVGLTVADLNGDGRPDLVVANSGSNDVTILIGTSQSDGTWSMIPGPRLKAGDRPVSTTVADISGDGNPDILVVNQDSNTVTVLRGLGGGFFDDNNPWTLMTGRTPVQAFVGHFSSSTLPGIVVLNSHSNSMTYYANLYAPEMTMSSGGIDPIAGVTGDFDKDGFADIAIANYFDAIISLFDGGPDGLRLAQTISLGASTRPTGLVVTGSKGAGLQFFVGATGEDHAISVVFKTVTAIETIISEANDGGLVTTGSLVRFTPSGLSNPSEFRIVIFEQPGNVVAAQSQESTSMGASSGGSSGVVSLASAIVTTLTQAAQPFFAPSSRTLGWLVENLVEMAQGPTAEILPLGKNEMAAVAVLLSASSVSAPVETRESAPLPVPTEDESPRIADSRLDPSPTRPPSKLDRFVANLGGTSVDFSRELAFKTDPTTESGSEWVWHRRTSDRSAIKSSFDHPLESSASPFEAEPTGELARLSELEATVDDTAEELAGVEPSCFTGWVTALTSLLALAIGIILVKRVRLKSPGSQRNRQDRPADRRSISSSLEERPRLVASSLTIKGRNSQDLPPWLQGPMSTRHRRPSTGHHFATTFFRKRTRES